MPHTTTLWTLRESRKHGMTRELLDAFRERAEAEGIETIAALVRLMRQYVDQSPAAGEVSNEENR